MLFCEPLLIGASFSVQLFILSCVLICKPSHQVLELITFFLNADPWCPVKQKLSILGLIGLLKLRLTLFEPPPVILIEVLLVEGLGPVIFCFRLSPLTRARFLLLG